MSTYGRHRRLDYLENSTNVKVVNKFKLLGIHFHPLLEGMDMNYKKALNSARAELFCWARKKLSLTGKVNVIKTYALSKFTHVAAILPNPGKEIIKEIESTITILKAINRSIVPRDLIFLPRSQGGLGVPKIETFWSTIKLAWLKRIYTSDAFWTTILNEGLPSGNINELMCYSPQTYHQTLCVGCNQFWH